MKILLSNDDGFDAPGLRALEACLAGLGELWTVAPTTEQSAKSHSLTMHEPLRVFPMGERRFAVSGTPADCVYLAVHHLLPGPPDLVVSGINRGSNLATDVYYSGTVAAAREAATMGIPAIAASLWVRSGNSPRWGVAAPIVRRVAEKVVEFGSPSGVVVNVNIPDQDPVAGVRLSSLARRYYQPLVDHKTDPRGRPYFWIGGDHERFEGPPDSDGPLCEQGYAVITPLQLDLTARELLATMRTWGMESD